MKRGEIWTVAGGKDHAGKPRSVVIIQDDSFMHYDLGFIDREQKTLQPLDNPFGPRLLPMS